jgi:hypothetical protein
MHYIANALEDYEKVLEEVIYLILRCGHPKPFFRVKAI